MKTSPKDGLIQREWRCFFDMCVPGGKAGTTEYVETRRVFFAGWMSAFAFFTKIIPEMKELDAMASVVKIRKEIERHLVDLKENRA